MPSDNKVVKQHKFCVVITLWEPERPVPDTITRCVNSLRSQRYKNWKCLIINDESQPRTRKQIEAVTQDDERFQVVYNQERRGALRNRVDGNNLICQDDEEIVVDLDGDDYLSDDHVLDFLNYTYQDEEIWATYGQYRFLTANELGQCTDSHKPFHRLDPHDTRVVSALRTYKYFLSKKVREEDLKDENGKYYERAEDAVRIWPIFEMAGKHLKFIPRVMYMYNNISEFNDSKIDPVRQSVTGESVRTKPAYMALANKGDDPFKKISVRLRDKNIGETFVANNANLSNYIEWYRGDEHRQFTVYTDKCFREAKDPDSVNIAWLLEPYSVDPDSHNYLLTNYSDFDYVLTYDKEILASVPNSYFVSTGVSYISKADAKIYPKTKKVCLMASEKNYQEGHHLRYELIENHASKIGVVYGTASTKFDTRLSVLKDYMYAIEIQNCRRDYYFSERLIDCFLTGTIPIYWGPPSIGKFFNTKGIITFTYPNDLIPKLEKLGVEDYNSRKFAMEDNFKRAFRYLVPEDYLYHHFLKKVIIGSYLV